MKHLRTTTLLMMAACASWAQQATGSLSGVISDPNGAAVPGASLTMRGESTGLELRATSSDAGLFVFATVPVGVYTLTAEKAGFKKINRTNVEIRVALRQEMNLAMEVGDVQQVIDVTAEAPLLESSTSERGQNFSPKFMDNLPLFTGGIRNPQAFVTYMPGVNAGSGETSVSGSGGRAQEVMIDGGSLTIPESGGTVFNFPSAEMFGEFKLLTGTYSAEYGRFGGGVQLYVTKSGTNWVHGTAFLNMRRDIWNANSWQNNSTGRVRAKERFNEIGGAAGGPIFIPKVYDGRNRTFWFFTYTKDQRPASIGFPVSTVPTVLMKQGNFTELGSTMIYDPATTANGVRQPFAGNVIPQSRFSQVSRRVLSLIPDPNAARLAQNYNFVSTNVFTRDIWSLKFDHAFTPGNRMSYWVSNESQVADPTTPFPGALGDGLFETQKPFYHRFNHDLSIQPTLLMHTLVSYSATRQGWNVPNQTGAASLLGIPGVPAEADVMPRVSFRGAAGLTAWGRQDGKVNAGGQNNDTFMISQGYTWVKGKHELKFGWDARWLSTFGFDLAGANGRYFFNRAQTAQSLATVSSTGHEFASLLLGAVDEADKTVLPVLFGTVNYRYLAGYVQDNWRVTKRLTLNLGMRYEIPIGWHEQAGDYSHVDLNRSNPAAGGRPGALVFAGTGAGRAGTLRFWDTDYSNIGPRVGAAYQLTSKTVLRGGWGIYYQTLGNGGCGCRQGFANTNAVQSDGFGQVINWDQPIPISPTFAPPPLLDPTISNFQNADHLGPSFGKAPRIYNWSFNIQHEWKSILFDLAYQANRGYGLNSTVDLNQLPTSRLSLGSLLGRSINDPLVQQAGFTAPFAGFGNRSLAQALRPYPQFLSLYSRNAAVGRTWYDSMQLRVERRFGSFQLLGTYVWSKSLGVAHFRQIFSQFGTAIPQDYYNIDDSKSFLPFDQPHVANILATWELPFGKGKRFWGSAGALANAAVGGWTISGAQRYYSGNLIQIVTPGNPLGNGVLFAGATKANRNNSVPVSTGFSRTSLDPNDPNARYFNAGAFSAAPAFTLGNAAFFDNDFRQPPIFIENLSIVKRTTLWENDKNPVMLVFRADAFNLFNRTNFGGIVGQVGNANFGRATAPQQGPRLITMGLRLDF